MANNSPYPVPYTQIKKTRGLLKKRFSLAPLRFIEDELKEEEKPQSSPALSYPKEELTELRVAVIDTRMLIKQHLQWHLDKSKSKRSYKYK